MFPQSAYYMSSAFVEILIPFFCLQETVLTSGVGAKDARDVIASSSNLFRKMWEKFGPNWAKFGQIWVKLEQIWINLNEIWVNLDKLDKI